MKVLKNPQTAQVAIEDKMGNQHVISTKIITTKEWEGFMGATKAIDQFVFLFGGDKEKYENDFAIQVIKAAVNWGLEQMDPTKSEAKEKQG